MKKILLVMGLAACFAVCQAQQTTPTERTPEQIADKQTEMLQRELRLTREQRDTIYKVHLRYARMRKISDKRADIEVRMENMRQEIRELLTEEQNTKFDRKMQEERQVRQAKPMLRRQEQTEPQTVQQ